jgi:hypothetical protein
MSNARLIIPLALAAGFGYYFWHSRSKGVYASPQRRVANMDYPTKREYPGVPQDSFKAASGTDVIDSQRQTPGSIKR